MVKDTLILKNIYDILISEIPKHKEAFRNNGVLGRGYSIFLFVGELYFRRLRNLYYNSKQVYHPTKA